MASSKKKANDKSKCWVMHKKPGVFSPHVGKNSRVGGMGGRPCAVFEYAGDAFEDKTLARQLIS